MQEKNPPALSWRWKIRDRAIDLQEKTLIMGVVNITPDSFSDGGKFDSPGKAIEHGRLLAAQGADIIDLGAESSKPGSAGTISDQEEWSRLQPVLEALRSELPDTIISIDTCRRATAKAALAAGADVINDIYALRKSPEIAQHCAEHNAGLILMHMQGEPATMQNDPQYENVLADIRTQLQEAMDNAITAGLSEECIVVDPGIGFGKTVDHNIEILAGLEYLRLMQRPICVGASRKAFLGKLTGDQPADNREEATIAAHCAAVLHGATIIRTHNIPAAKKSLAIIDAIRNKAEM